jgi:hypothetical protein
MIGSDAGPFTDPDGFAWDGIPHRSEPGGAAQLDRSGI